MYVCYPELSVLLIILLVLLVIRIISPVEVAMVKNSAPLLCGSASAKLQKQSNEEMVLSIHQLLQV